MCAHQYGAAPPIGDFKWTPAASRAGYPAPEAFLCIASLAAAVDRHMGHLESELLHFVTHRWWALGVVAEKDVTALHYAVTARLGALPDEALTAACAALPAPMRLAAFAKALDIMMCDGVLQPAESAFAETLAAKLDLSEADAERIRGVIATLNAF